MPKQRNYFVVSKGILAPRNNKSLIYLQFSRGKVYLEGEQEGRFGSRFIPLKFRRK